MIIKGMAPRYTYTNNNLGINLNDFFKVEQEFKQLYNAKLTLPKQDTYYSNDKFIGLPFFVRSATQYNGHYLALNNIAKPSSTEYKVSSIDSNNQIDFRSGKSLKLGDYNGVAVELKMNENINHIDSNLSVPSELASKNGERFNEYERTVIEMNEKISDNQREEIAGIQSAFNEFCRIADDEELILHVSDNNHNSLILGVEKMGVDISKPFAINGEEFYLRNDTGKVDYYNVKKYVSRDDGSVEIHDATNENPSDVWHELSTKYDVRNASFEEIEDISKKLLSARQITAFEAALLTFHSNESPQSTKSDINLTNANVNGKYDWVAEFEARSTRDNKNGNLRVYELNQRILGVLKKLS